MPRSAIMTTRARRLSLKLVYQVTHKMMICPSKCRPLNTSSIGKNRCISSIIARHPRVCTRAFHRTVQEEFYATAFRKKLYHGLEELQADLDEWMREYNLTRTHSGKYCYGKTPMQTFLDSAHLAQEKMLDSLRPIAPEPERSPAERSAGGGAVADAAA